MGTSNKGNMKFHNNACKFGLNYLDIMEKVY